MVGNQGTLVSWGGKTKLIMTKSSRQEPAIIKLEELREQGEAAESL